MPVIQNLLGRKMFLYAIQQFRKSNEPADSEVIK